MKLNFVGDVFSPTGFGAHIKQLSEATYKLNKNTSLETPLPQDWNKECSDAIYEMVMNDFKEETNIMINLPLYWPFKLSERPKKTIGFGIFEGDKVSRHWAELANTIDMLLVPSDHTGKAFNNGGVPANKIKKVPHGVDTKLFHPKAKPHELFMKDIQETDSEFTFVFLGGWAKGTDDRKGLDILLRAYTEEFKPDEKVFLVAKVNPAYGFRQDLQTEIIQLGLKPQKERRPFMFSNVPLEYKDIPSIYALCDVFVCPSKAEAFGLNYLEAMGCAKPCIATEFGGQTDYIDNKNGYLLSINGMTQATGEVFYEDTKWAIPNQKHLQVLLRYTFENQKEVKTKGKKARKTAEKMTWRHSAQKLLKAIK